MIMLSTPKELIENANKIQRYFKYSLTTAILLLTLSACGGGGGSTSFDDTTTLNAPIITSNDTVSVNENQTAALTVTATDADEDTLTYSLTGADASSFDINATTGVVTFKIPSDYENKSSYIFTANVNDGANTATQRITVTVINVAEFVPRISTLNSSIDENVAVGTVVNSINILNSGDSPITSFTLSDTTDFGISASGEITTKTPLDFETTAEYNLSAFASNSAGDSVSESVVIKINDIYEVIPVYVPTLVVVMNWTNYSETGPLIWYNKFFDKTQNSVNRWFDETTGGKLVLVPVTESSGKANDGVIMVSMGKPHPGDYNNTTFRDTEIYNAITNLAVVDSMDFAALDTDGNGYLNKKELQIVFIVAGGESSYRDAVDHSIWAHAWAFDSASTLSVDGVLVMKYTGVNATSGSYARFGANHGTHKATIGVIAHELGHSLLSLWDYYDNGGGSGLGWYDIMSGGSWARQTTDIYPGETPTQYSAYNTI